MKQKQPFLTRFPTQLCGSPARSLQDVISAKCLAMRRSSLATYAVQFEHILPAHFLNKISTSKRIRHYSNVTVFWAWMAQILEANASLTKAVSLVQAWCDDAGLPKPKSDTGAYSKARHRSFDKRKGKRIGKNERIVTWRKPATQPKGSVLDKDSWEAIEPELTVRLIWFYFKDRAGKKRQMVLTTTLLDADKYKWTELADLYLQRWDIELRLRDVKTTLQMETFNVKTPETAHKTLEMTLIAYNLIKLTMQEAAHEAGEDHRLMSFKGALDTVVAFSLRYARQQNHVRVVQRIWSSMVEVLSEKMIKLRPNRHEPRAIKRRPKSFSVLTKPRALFTEPIHKGGYRSYA